MNKQLAYYHNLDGLRGIAALAVLVFHFFGGIGRGTITDYVATDFYWKASEIGQHGVSLFFVLSGFVIGRILINSRENDNYFRLFYWRRALRILPLYYLFLLFWYFLLPFILQGSEAEIVPFRDQVPFYTYVQNFDWLLGFRQVGPPHYWTLAVEEHFYLACPLFIYLVPVRYIKPLIIAVVVLLIPLKYYFLRIDIPIGKNTFTRFDQILLGVLLAYYEVTGRMHADPARYKKIFLTILASLIPIGALIYFGQRYIPEIKEVIKYTLLGMVFFSILGLLILYRGGIVNRFLESKVMQYLGRISYGIYIWQISMIYIANKFLKTELMWIDLLTCTMLTILVSHISFFYFEKKFLKYK